MGKRFTWVIVAGVGALLIFAGVDALRSIGGSKKATTSAASTTSPGNAANTLPVRRCARNEPEVSIEMRAGFATVVVRNTVCKRLLRTPARLEPANRGSNGQTCRELG